MPRLSIAVPYRHDDQRLEATVLSILENRPADCEIIVAHDGSYQDPYDLGDEVVLIEEKSGSSPVELINASCLAACSPIVHTVWDGVQVHFGWADDALERMEFEQDLAAIAVPVVSPTGMEQHGVDVDQLCDLPTVLDRGIASRLADHADGPQMQCGFYRRKVLLALGGFLPSRSPAAADADFALALEAVRNDENELLVAEMSGQTPLEYANAGRVDNVELKELASIAVAHGIAVSGMASKVRTLTAGITSGRIARAIAWATGLNQRQMQFVSDRIERARQQVQSLATGSSSSIPFPAALSERRAA